MECEPAQFSYLTRKINNVEHFLECAQYQENIGMKNMSKLSEQSVGGVQVLKQTFLLST